MNTKGHKTNFPARRRALVCAALCALVSAAHAQTLTLPQCLDLAAEHNIALKTADAQVERARIMQGTAWDVDKTEVSLGQDPTSGGSPDNALAVTQQIEFPTVYAARRRQLKAETRAEAARRNIVAAQLRADIAAAYCEAVYCQEVCRIIAAQDSVLLRYAAVAKSRYEAGEARQIESLSAERMLRENNMEKALAEADLLAARTRLATLIGAGQTVTPADASLQPLPFAADGGYNYAATAEGEYAQQRLTALDRAVSAAKGGYAPTLSLSLRNQLVITGWDPYHENRARYAGGNFMGFEVGVGIPLFFGATKAKVKAARKDREIASLEMQQEQEQRKGEYAAAMGRYVAARNRMEYYDSRGTQSAEEMARLGATEYENGEISYLEYVNAVQEAADARKKRAAAVNDYNQAVVALKRITGDI